MKVLTIINNNRITGVTYGMVETNQPQTTIKYKKYKDIHTAKKTKYTKRKDFNIRANTEQTKHLTNTNDLTVTLPVVIELEPFYVFDSFVVKHFRKMRDKQHTKMLKNKRAKKALLQANTFYKTRKNLDAIFEAIAKEKVK
nr:hypothetical protein [Candidatus Enterousia merdequi]